MNFAEAIHGLNRSIKEQCFRCGCPNEIETMFENCGQHNCDDRT